jgi:hypothetical protein
MHYALRTHRLWWAHALLLALVLLHTAACTPDQPSANATKTNTAQPQTECPTGPAANAAAGEAYWNPAHTADPFTDVFAAATSTANGWVPLTARPEALVAQRFSIDPQRETTITTTGGLVLTVPPGIWQDAQGRRITARVQLTIREAKTMRDFIAAGLATTSNGRVLQSGGMYHFAARTASGQAVRVQPESVGLMALFPIPSDLAYELFTGRASINGSIDWDAQPGKLNGSLAIEQVLADGFSAPAPDTVWSQTEIRFTSNDISESNGWIVPDTVGGIDTQPGSAIQPLINRGTFVQNGVGLGGRTQILTLGWYNIDCFINEPFQLWKGVVVYTDGSPAIGQSVYAFCRPYPILLHTLTDNRGRFKLEVPRRFSMHIAVYAEQRRASCHAPFTSQTDTLRLHNTTAQSLSAFLDATFAQGRRF